jgi:ligand-binding SRPBCC domain-containing protein
MLCGITQLFEATESGTKMTDVVHYALPLGFIGRIMNTWSLKQIDIF